MNLARTTIGISRRLEALSEGRPGRRGVVTILLVVSALLVLTGGILVLSDVPMTPLITVGSLVAAILVFSLMVVRNDWVFLLAVIAGHTIFYGKLGDTLGMRIRDSFGPADVLFILALVAGIVYWAGAREKPKVPWPLVAGPVVLFFFVLAYISVALFLWNRQDNGVFQAVGWAYFPLALPAYVSLTTGRIWKSYFTILFLAMVAGACISTFLEIGILPDVAKITGYGALHARSFGALAPRGPMLGMTIMTVMIATIILGFSKTKLWSWAALIAGVAGLWIIFLDRGRIHYAGIAASMTLIYAFMPSAERLKSLFRYFVFSAVVIFALEGTGGTLAKNFNESVEKAVERISLTSSDALAADTGIAGRNEMIRQAMSVFREYPLLGGGPGIQFGSIFDWTTYTNVPIQFLDNTWAYVLAVGGITAMSLIMFTYITMMGAVIVAYIKLKNPLHKSLCIVPLGSYLWCLICSQVTWWMVDRWHVAAFSLGTGMALALVYHEKVHGSEVPIVKF